MYGNNQFNGGLDDLMGIFGLNSDTSSGSDECDDFEEKEYSPREKKGMDSKYTELRKLSTLKICKMKSGTFKILDFYNNDVGEEFYELYDAKAEYISIHKK